MFVLQSTKVQKRMSPTKCSFIKKKRITSNEHIHLMEVIRFPLTLYYIIDTNKQESHPFRTPTYLLGQCLQMLSKVFRKADR